MTCVKKGTVVKLDYNCYGDICGNWKNIQNAWLSSSTVCVITKPKSMPALTILITENGHILKTESNEIIII